MFKVQEQDAIKWPVDINIPRDGGNVVKATMTAQFEIIDEDEYNDLLESGADKAILRRVLIGWGKDYCNTGGDPIEFSEEERENLIKIPYARIGLINAYIECAYGNKSSKSAKVKN